MGVRWLTAKDHRIMELERAKAELKEKSMYVRMYNRSEEHEIDVREPQAA